MMIATMVPPYEFDSEMCQMAITPRLTTPFSLNRPLIELSPYCTNSGAAA
jgi:hypothetical protein